MSRHIILDKTLIALPPLCTDRVLNSPRLSNPSCAHVRSLGTCNKQLNILMSEDSLPHFFPQVNPFTNPFPFKKKSDYPRAETIKQITAIRWGYRNGKEGIFLWNCEHRKKLSWTNKSLCYSNGNSGFFAKWSGWHTRSLWINKMGLQYH